MTYEPSIDEGRETILDALERHRVSYVVIGGAAAQARGWPEPTDVWPAGRVTFPLPALARVR